MPTKHRKSFRYALTNDIKLDFFFVFYTENNCS